MNPFIYKISRNKTRDWNKIEAGIRRATFRFLSITSLTLSCFVIKISVFERAVIATSFRLFQYSQIQCRRRDHDIGILITRVLASLLSRLRHRSACRLSTFWIIREHRSSQRRRSPWCKARITAHHHRQIQIDVSALKSLWDNRLIR